MTYAENLRLKARRCRRLGAGQDPKTELALSDMAEEYDAEALALEIAVAAAFRPHSTES
jgi:hypothetical protein